MSRTFELVKIVIAADHAGYPLKEGLVRELEAAGHEVEDLGTHTPETPSDYPDWAERLGEALAHERAEGREARGLFLCGSGVGATIASNKIPDVRASVCHDTYSAHQGVEHDDMNVLCLGGRVVGVEPAREIVRAFAAAKFSGDERHRRRVGTIRRIEKRHFKG